MIALYRRAGIPNSTPSHHRVGQERSRHQLDPLFIYGPSPSGLPVYGALTTRITR